MAKEEEAEVKEKNMNWPEKGHNSNGKSIGFHDCLTVLALHLQCWLLWANTACQHLSQTQPAEVKDA